MDPHLPALPIGVEEDEDHVLVTSDGETRRHLNAIYAAEDVARIRQGYCCIQCGESQVDHDAPFPERCWVCGFPMRDRQLERLATEWMGNVRVGPSTSVDEELEIAREMVERQKHSPKPSIIVPSSPLVIPGGFR